GVRIDSDEAGSELIAVANANEPRVVLSALVTEREKFLEHHRDFHAVRRCQRVKLEGMLADGELLLVRRPGDGAIDVREASAVLLVPGPDFGRRIFGAIAHVGFPYVV